MPHRLSAAIAVGCLLAMPAAAETCKASWYGFESGRTTASGAPFDPGAMTAAHRTLPFGTRVKVTLLRSRASGATMRSAIVTITDRGPAKWTGRCIDLSRGAAKVIGIIRAGVATVKI